MLSQRRRKDAKSKTLRAFAASHLRETQLFWITSLALATRAGLMIGLVIAVIIAHPADRAAAQVIKVAIIVALCVGVIVLFAQNKLGPKRFK